MSRQVIIAGNWKMNLNLDQAEDLVAGLRNNYANLPGLEVVVAPPALLIPSVSDMLPGSTIQLSGQDCSDKMAGAYTGQNSVELLKAFGCNYCVIGHSERREFQGETDELIAAKAKLLISLGMTPIYCIGETLEQREAGEHFELLKNQVKAAYDALDPEMYSKLVFAYEPIWAIGTGVTASPEQAEEIHAFLRKEIAGFANEEIAAATTIMYGGSAKPNNAKELLSKENVDGFLVGGASLKASDFLEIIKAYQA